MEKRSSLYQDAAADSLSYKIILLTRAWLLSNWWTGDLSPATDGNSGQESGVLQSQLQFHLKAVANKDEFIQAKSKII